MECSIICSTLSGSTLFCSEKEIQFYLFGNYNLWHLDIYNGPTHVYCIKPEGRIHYNIKGYLRFFLNGMLWVLVVNCEYMVLS